MSKRYKPGDTFTKKTRGIEYLYEVQEKGRAKPVKRLTPYKDKRKANLKSTIPETQKTGIIVPATPRQFTKHKPLSDQNLTRLPGTRNIYIAENTLTVERTERVNSKTIKIVHTKK